METRATQQISEAYNGLCHIATDYVSLHVPVGVFCSVICSGLFFRTVCPVMCL